MSSSEAKVHEVDEVYAELIEQTVQRVRAEQRALEADISTVVERVRSVSRAPKDWIYVHDKGAFMTKDELNRLRAGNGLPPHGEEPTVPMPLPAPPSR